MTILPNAMLKAVTKLTHIMRATGTWLVTPGPSPCKIMLKFCHAS